ncbi:MAG: M20/M25/M40 family metallo-hydrolase [Phycisphaeraceae bacterium]|nr:MAG: M20/M25/M40 family metallo-hydrolase [Phycisphaeraceae bacterium]
MNDAAGAVINGQARREHERWLLELTGIPTAAGREHRVVAWIARWLAERDDLQLRTDRAGNMEIAHTEAPDPTERPPLYITAHLDHPAFVVEQIVGPGTVRLSFRGGVLDPYFVNAPIQIITQDDRVVRATLLEAGPASPHRDCLAELDDDGSTDGIAVGDIGRWENPEARVTDDGILETHACDDLAAVAAALGAMDVLRGHESARHVRLLFTRAEEVGFIGAIAAMREGWIDKASRLVLLENSRAFAESPIDGGPIVRVGDRMSTFSPELTSAFAKVAEDIAKQREGSGDAFRWQRKLMPGGACEATVFQAWGYEATCLCLPLGNYHNMANLAEVQAKEPDAVASARCGPEQIALSDFHGLVDLLVGAGLHLAEVPPMIERLEKLYEERKGVLEDLGTDGGVDTEGAAWGLTRGA